MPFLPQETRICMPTSQDIHSENLLSWKKFIVRYVLCFIIVTERHVIFFNGVLTENFNA